MTKSKRFLLIGLFICAFFGTRIPHLSNDVINPDGVNWHYRTQQFVVGLKFFQLEKTYQHYHPGVTLMWVTGIPIEIFKQITNISHYDIYNFESFHLIAKYTIIFIQLVLSILTIYLLEKIIGFKKALLMTTLFTFEPFFLGNSRLYHLDVLVSLLLFIGLLYSFLNLKNVNLTKSLGAGLFLALAFLTKSIAIGGVMFVIFYGISYFIANKDKGSLWKYITLVSVFFVISTFLFFPALWKNPVYFLSEIFREAERVGIRKGHGQIILGEYTRDAGVLFYPLAILLKVSPFVLSGVVLFVVLSFSKAKVFFRSVREKFLNLSVFLSIFYIGYVVVMTFPAKKIDRYMIVIYPWLAYLATLGLHKLFEYLRRFEVGKAFFWILITALFGLFWVKPLIECYPYYFTYTSPVFGGSVKANAFIAQKPFGVGIPKLKEHVLQNYGYYPDLGFIDTKPMRSIYPNSKIFDIRVSGTSNYNLLILGVNEEIPEKVLGSNYVFEKDSSVWINGLEYWRIYVKKEK